MILRFSRCAVKGKPDHPNGVQTVEIAEIAPAKSKSLHPFAVEQSGFSLGQVSGCQTS